MKSRVPLILFDSVDARREFSFVWRCKMRFKGVVGIFWFQICCGLGKPVDRGSFANAIVVWEDLFMLYRGLMTVATLMVGQFDTI